MNLIRDLLLAILPPLVVLVLQALRMFFFPDAADMDMVAHFFGGFAIAWGASLVWMRWRARKLIPAKLPLWIAAWSVFGAVLFASIAWELWEFVMEQNTGWIFQPSLADTMNDFVMDMSGGLLFIAFIWKKLR